MARSESGLPLRKPCLSGKMAHLSLLPLLRVSLLPLPLAACHSMASILRSLHNTCAGGIEPACTDAPDGASPPAGNAKTHSTPSHDDGVEHK